MSWRKSRRCDPVEFRLKNLAQSGESIHPGMRPIDADIPGDIREAARMLHMDRPLAPGHGRSVCCSASDAGAHPVTLAMVQVYADGSVSVLSGSTEIGQGSHTVLAQIAAEEMGVPLEKVRLVGSDTAVTLVRTLHRRQPHHHVDGPRRAGSVPRGDRANQGDGGGSLRGARGKT